MVPHVRKTDWRSFAVRKYREPLRQARARRSCFLAPAGRDDLRRVLEDESWGAILRVKELNIDRAHRGARSCTPVTASFKPGLTGRLCDARGHGRIPPSAKYFQLSHSLAIGTNPYTCEKCHHSLPGPARHRCRREQWMVAAPQRCGGLDRRAMVSSALRRVHWVSHRSCLQE